MDIFSELKQCMMYQEYERYTIFEDGSVFNSRSKNQLKFNVVTNRNGRRYPKFHLYVNKEKELWFGHRLIAWVFLGRDHYSLEEFKSLVVDHIDNDPMNFSLSNVDILNTSRENLLRRHQDFSPTPF